MQAINYAWFIFAVVTCERLPLDGMPDNCLFRNGNLLMSTEGEREGDKAKSQYFKTNKTSSI